MEGHLFVVDPDTSRVISRVASLHQCSNEGEVKALVDQWQDRVGDDLVILDSRNYHWLGEVKTLDYSDSELGLH